MNQHPPIADCSFAASDQWYEGIPLGNGDLGGLVYGATDRMTIAVGKNDMWDRRAYRHLEKPITHRQYMRLCGEGRAYRPETTGERPRGDFPQPKPVCQITICQPQSPGTPVCQPLGEVRHTLSLEHGVFVAVVNFWQVSPEASKRLFAEPGDHAGALETSLLLHWCPQCVQTEHAGPGTGRPFAVPALRQPGVWTPRPWSQIHPDLGAGNPAEASAEKGAELARIICMTVADLLVQLAAAERLP